MNTEWDFMEQKIRETGSYVIYGAGVVAYNVYLALQLRLRLSPECFVVTDLKAAGRDLDHIPVVSREYLKEKYHSSVGIVVATPEIYHAEITELLRKDGYRHIVCVDAHREYLLMSEYFRNTHKLTILSDLPYEKNRNENLSGSFGIYMAKSHKDKPLKGTYEIPEWVRPVQAGSACTDLRIASWRDDEGIQISGKNPNYCELTVTYWVWKNRKDAYKGICHYRRMLLLDETQLKQCVDNDIDVILPLPFVCYPDARGQYDRYISGEDQKALRRALSEIAPEYLETWKLLDSQNCFYNYNMLVAKEDLFDQYSHWLFSVLERAEKYCDPQQKRADRYAGYLGELLTSLYLFKHKNGWKIAHAEKNWMV